MIANVASAAWSNAKYAAIATCAACVHSAFGSLPAFHASTNRCNSLSLFSNANVSRLGAGLLESAPPDAVECVSIRFLSPYLSCIMNRRKCYVNSIVSQGDINKVLGCEGPANPDAQRPRHLGRVGPTPRPLRSFRRRSRSQTRTARRHPWLRSSRRPGIGGLSAHRLRFRLARQPPQPCRIPPRHLQDGRECRVSPRCRRRRLPPEGPLPRHPRSRSIASKRTEV